MKLHLPHSRITRYEFDHGVHDALLQLRRSVHMLLYILINIMQLAPQLVLLSLFPDREWTAEVKT